MTTANRIESERPDLMIASLRQAEIGDRALRQIARECALSVLPLWKGRDIVERYLRTGDESIRARAQSVASEAAASLDVAADGAGAAYASTYRAGYYAALAAANAAEVKAGVAAESAVVAAGAALSWLPATAAATEDNRRRLCAIIRSVVPTAAVRS